MADEIKVFGTLIYEDDEGGSIKISDDGDVVVDITTKKFTQVKVSVGLTEEAIPLGEVSALGWAFFKNHDDTNFAQIRTATSGTAMIKVPAGAFAGPFMFGSGVTAPFWIADTAAVMMTAVILST
jgi:hypothetical protein